MSVKVGAVIQVVAVVEVVEAGLVKLITILYECVCWC